MAKEIVDYGHSRKISAVFVVILILFIAYGLYQTLLGSADSYMIYVVYTQNSFILFVLSIIFGLGVKRAINYIPGKWEHIKKWVSFKEYEEIVDKYEAAYGNLFASTGAQSTLVCCLIPLLTVIGVFFIIYQEFIGPLLGNTLYSILIVPLLYGIIGFVGFLIGFRSIKIDSDEFFKPPEKGDNYEFASALASVPYLRDGVNVELGEREGVLTLLDAEWKIYVKDLPETVNVKVQVSHSGFAYPYLVGTIYKGPHVGKNTETLRIGTRYPAIIEYSMDKEVTVLVARFDIPSRTSSVPSISTGDFRKLGATLAGKLASYYEMVS